MKELLKEVVIPGVITVSLVGAVIYLAVTGQDIPELLSAFAGTGIGYFLNYATTSRSRK